MPGKEKPVQAQQEHGRKSPHGDPGRDAERIKVAKHAAHVPRKAAIVYAVPVP